MLNNKSSDMTPYDMARKPSKQYPILLPVIWGGSFLMTRQFGLKITKNLRGVKPPYLIYSTHQGFSDYYVGPLSMFPRRCMFVSDMEGFAAFGNWLYRGIGCIPKRRYVPDLNVMRNIKYGLKRGQSVMIFPESRHANIGTTSYVPQNLGRLAKLLKVPVVVLSINGSYLANPFWDEEHTRKVKMKAELKCLYTVNELSKASSSDIQKNVEKHLQYDEYKYQQDEGILIKDKNRAKGIHIPLYQCRKCSTKYHMTSEGITLKCNNCGASWELTEDGWLFNGSRKTHIPDWYEWERQEATKDTSNFDKKFKVRIEALPNEKGFVNLGEGELTMDSKEFVLTFPDKTRLNFPHKLRESLQTEYNYRGKGMAVVLSTKDCCYYLYSTDADFNPTELQFISEYLFNLFEGFSNS